MLRKAVQDVILCALLAIQHLLLRQQKLAAEFTESIRPLSTALPNCINLQADTTCTQQNQFVNVVKFRRKEA